jgi:sterol desaturase/sphingolipid hydroxylase (fatty acid hydroxylase superfamily)
MDPLGYLKVGITVALLALFWAWETARPFFAPRADRLPHAGRNLAIALLNAGGVALCCGLAMVLVTGWTTTHQLGLLNAAALPSPLRWLLVLILLDGWMYLWHRANHSLPFLWRFHRMHHSDPALDVTTADRFHLGELALSAILRLALVPLLGLGLVELLVYDTVVAVVTHLHHANISLGRWDRPLRALIVTPTMHKVHHSRWRPETNSNYATVLSVWDRLFGSFRMRPDLAAIEPGLNELDGPAWQSFAGLWRTPFQKARMP